MKGEKSAAILAEDAIIEMWYFILQIIFFSFLLDEKWIDRPFKRKLKCCYIKAFIKLDRQFQKPKILIFIMIFSIKLLHKSINFCHNESMTSTVTKFDYIYSAMKFSMWKGPFNFHSFLLEKSRKAQRP